MIALAPGPEGQSAYLYEKAESASMNQNVPAAKE